MSLICAKRDGVSETPAPFFPRVSPACMLAWNYCGDGLLGVKQGLMQCGLVPVAQGHRLWVLLSCWLACGTCWFVCGRLPPASRMAAKRSCRSSIIVSRLYPPFAVAAGRTVLWNGPSKPQPLSLRSRSITFRSSGVTGYARVARGNLVGLAFRIMQRTDAAPRRLAGWCSLIR
ncbi:unnamed protein product [Phaeothamnion confervicola]